MCGDLSKENNDLKKEIKLLKFKVTRLNNKIAKNQMQWAETLQELQQESHEHDLTQDSGKSFFFYPVSGWGAIQWEATTKNILNTNYNRK